jgi:hypothetical protein
MMLSKPIGRPQPYVFKKSHGITFEEWMARVSAIMFFRSGLAPQEIPTYNYEAAYDADNPPAIAATNAIRNAKEPSH